MWVTRLSALSHCQNAVRKKKIETYESDILMGKLDVYNFLDRDGVINENRADYVKSWSEFRFLPGSREAIAKLTQAGHRIVVCTNQAGIARGTISVEAVEDIHHRMIESIM